MVGLIICAGIVGLFIRFDRRREADLAKLVHPRFRQRLTEGFSPPLRNLKRGLWLLAVFLLFVAVARPQKGYEWREVKRKGIDILFAVDTSRSMLAEDLTPNRLERARLGIIDFVSKLEGDRVGLIPFAGTAFALCPLTLDYVAFRESLNALDTDLIPRQGTDLASAIKEAERLFNENGNNHRVLVLLTDGEDLQGDVLDAAKAATGKGMAIYTVGVGSPSGASIPIRYPNGRTDYVRDEKGQVVKTTLDEGTLKKIAEVTGGLYVSLGRGAEGLNKIYQEKLRLVPKSELEQKMERIPLERFEWPLGAAFSLLLLEFFIRDRRRVKSVSPMAALTSVTACLLILTGTSRAQDTRQTYNQGTEAYQKGDFGKAVESLRASLKTQDLALQQRSYYNLGNTLFRAGQGTQGRR
jgi:Ca-activated chloride channel homolog